MLFSKWIFFFWAPMRSVYIILYSTSHLEIVAVGYTRIKLTSCEHICLWKSPQFASRPPAHSLLLKNFLKCRVFIWGKVVVYAFPCQFKHLILQCFYSLLREKQSCKESHNDTVPGMYSHVNRIMEVFVCLGLTTCFQLLLSTLAVELPFITYVESCLVNWGEEHCSYISAFSLHSVSACLCHTYVSAAA